MSLLFDVEKSLPGADPSTEAMPALSVASTSTARWFDPGSQYVAWCLRLTNAGDAAITDLAATFAYAGNGGACATGLSLTSVSARGGPIRSWGRSRSLARTYPGAIAAWETLLVTGVFTTTSNAGGSLSVTFELGAAGPQLASVSAEF